MKKLLQSAPRVGKNASPQKKKELLVICHRRLLSTLGSRFPLLGPRCCCYAPSACLLAHAQPGKLKPKDLKEAIRRTRADRQRQLEEQEALRALTASAPAGNEADVDIDGALEDPDPREGYATVHGPERGGGVSGQQQQPAQLSGRAICAYEATAVGGGGGGGGVGATRQLKEMSFLHDLADTEAEERDRSFKASGGLALGVVCRRAVPVRRPERRRVSDGNGWGVVTRAAAFMSKW